MLKKFLLKIFHKKHKFISTEIMFRCVKEDEVDFLRGIFPGYFIKREILSCEICEHVEIIERLAIRFHQGNITEPIGTITTKKT